MILKAHGDAWLRSGRRLLEADRGPRDGGVSTLGLRLEDHQTLEVVTGKIRLDPWRADEYVVVEFETGNCFLVCGDQAVVAVDSSSLAWSSSVGLEPEEVDTLDAPWHAEDERARVLLVATKRRVWCVDARGAIRWIWVCAAGDQARWITAAPEIRGERAVIPLATFPRSCSVELSLRDGLPVLG